MPCPCLLNNVKHANIWLIMKYKHEFTQKEKRIHLTANLGPEFPGSRGNKRKDDESLISY